MLDKNSILKDVSRYYNAKVLSFGATPAGVDWNSEESQKLRFSQLLKIIDNEGNFTLNDFGCGYGALSDELIKKYKSFSYVGFDISPEMIKKAEEIYSSHENINFFNASKPKVIADYSIASGIFNVMLNNDSKSWKSYLEDTLGLINDYSKKGFAFNLLTDYSDEDKKEEKLYYASPEDIFKFCKESFSRNVSLLHDYGLYEFTVLVKKDVE